MRILYLDESGDHDLVNIDKNYPIFALGGCVMDSGYHDRVLKPAMNSFKEKVLGNSVYLQTFLDTSALFRFAA
jgi:hypothetical protein